MTCIGVMADDRCLFAATAELWGCSSSLRNLGIAWILGGVGIMDRDLLQVVDNSLFMPLCVLARYSEVAFP